MKNSKAYLTMITMISALGGFLFGYDWVVVGGAKPFYEQYFSIASDAALQGWAMSSALLGCLIGVTIAGSLSDRWGRKPMLIMAAIFFLVSAYGIGASNSFTMFIAFRIFGGLGIGMASNLSPMYIAEVSPAAVRGKYVSFNQLTIVLGILAAQLTNWLISDAVPQGATAEFIRESWNGQTGWRVMFWAGMIPAAIFMVAAFFIPETPRWLASKGQFDKAHSILKKIGGEDFARTEVASIKNSSDADKAKFSLSMLTQKGMGKLLMIGIVLAVFQQWCGINVIFNYAQEVFASAGYGVSDILFNIVITGVINVVFTFVALALVDKLGRKPLLIIGSAALTIIYALLGGAFYMGITGVIPVVLVMLAIASYAMTLSAVMWVVISEIFPTRIRAAAMGISTFALWSACFLLTYTFPLLNTGLGTYGTFWLYGIICLLGLLFILKYVKETKGLSLEQIEKVYSSEDK